MLQIVCDKCKAVIPGTWYWRVQSVNHYGDMGMIENKDYCLYHARSALKQAFEWLDKDRVEVNKLRQQ